MSVKSNVSASADIIDFFDYAPAPEPRRCAKRRPSSPRQLKITDDWPERIPVTEAELDVFEVHFGPLLDELLGSKN